MWYKTIYNCKALFSVSHTGNFMDLRQPTQTKPNQTFPREVRLESWDKGKKKMNDGGGERRNRLPANPTILKNCVRPRTQLLIGAVRVVLIT